MKHLSESLKSKDNTIEELKSIHSAQNERPLFDDLLLQQKSR